MLPRSLTRAVEERSDSSQVGWWLGGSLRKVRSAALLVVPLAQPKGQLQLGPGVSWTARSWESDSAATPRVGGVRVVQEALSSILVWSIWPQSSAPAGRSLEVPE